MPMDHLTNLLALVRRHKPRTRAGDAGNGDLQPNNNATAERWYIEPTSIQSHLRCNEDYIYQKYRLLSQRASGKFWLTLPIVCGLHKQLLDRTLQSAGVLRTCPVHIRNASHQPPPWCRVPNLVGKMCEYANAHATPSQAIHCAAYLLWRVNWIHPFLDGNGRTARALSYVALCTCYGMDLPGKVKLPQMLEKKKRAYYSALDAADNRSFEGHRLKKTEQLLKTLLERQLESAIV